MFLFLRIYFISIPVFIVIYLLNFFWIKRLICDEFGCIGISSEDTIFIWLYTLIVLGGGALFIFLAYEASKQIEKKSVVGLFLISCGTLAISIVAFITQQLSMVLGVFWGVYLLYDGISNAGKGGTDISSGDSSWIIFRNHRPIVFWIVVLTKVAVGGISLCISVFIILSGLFQR